MHDYLFTVEVVRFAFVVGIVVSILMYERRHLTTGSIVVPGYIGVFLIQPLVIVATFANALFTYWVVNKVLPRWVLLYGRTKFVVLALLSIGIQALMLEISPSGPYLWESDIPLVVGVGYVIPALVAHDMARQGVKKTSVSVLIAGLIVAAAVGITLLTSPGDAAARAPLEGFGVMSIDPGWVPLAVFLSAAAAWGLLKNYGLRSGGFVGAAYVGMLAAEVTQVIMVALVALSAYLIVAKLLLPHLILFGRRKFASMLIVAGGMSWVFMWIGQLMFDFQISYYMTLGSVALTPLFVPGLLANDMERAGIGRVAIGTTLGACFVVPATWSAEAVTHGEVPVFWVTVAIVTGSIIFRNQIVTIGRWVVRTSVDLVRGEGGRHRAAIPVLDPIPPPPLPAQQPVPAHTSSAAQERVPAAH